MAAPDRPRPDTPGELSLEQRALLGRDAARIQDESSQDATVVQEEKKEDLFQAASRLEREAVAWIGTHAEALAKKGLKPSRDRARRGEELRRATEGTTAEYGATPVADRDIATSAQQAGGDVARVGAETATQIAIEAAKVELGGRAIEGLGAAVGGVRRFTAAQRQIEKARRSAVRGAWKQETVLVRKTGRGTRQWTEAEKVELLRTGKVKGYEGHHINNVARNPGTAADPDNIFFARGRRGHLAEHSGNFRNATSGPLLDRAIKE